MIKSQTFLSIIFKKSLHIFHAFLWNKAFLFSVYLFICSSLLSAIFFSSIYYLELSDEAVRCTFPFYCIAYALTILALYTCISSIPKIGFYLTSSLFLLISTISYYYYFTLNVPPSSQALWMLYNTPPSMLGENVSAFLDIKLLLKALIPNFIILMGAYFLFFSGRLKFKKINFKYTTYFGCMTISSFFLWFTFIYPFAYTFEPNAYGITNIIYFIKDATFFNQKRDVLPSLSNQNPQNNVVMIIDESVRADYLQINNPAVQTTPFLCQFAKTHPKNIFNYGIAIASSTVSLYSVTTLMSLIDTVPDINAIAIKQPLLFHIAKQHGYKIHYIDIQDGRLVHMNPNDWGTCDYISKGHIVQNEPYYNQDKFAAQYINTLCNKSTGNFVFLIKGGVHYHYENVYSEDSKHAIFLPKLEKNEPFHTSRLKMINSYKNALRYNVDPFFETLLLPLPKETTFIYTSDHGQSLQEDNIPHVTHSGILKEQTFVPLIVISTDSWVQGNLLSSNLDNNKHISHLNITPTLRSIITHKRKIDKQKYTSLLDPQFQYGPLLYSNGSLWNRTKFYELPQGAPLLDTHKYMY